MAGILIMLALVGYLAFVVDWKEFLGVMRLGGWAAVAVYVAVTVAIVVILTSAPEVAQHAPAMHH